MKTATRHLRLPAAVLILLLSTGLVSRAVITTNLLLDIPGSGWALVINTPGFDLQKRGISPDGSAAQLMAVNLTNDIILSAFIEKAADGGDARRCREFYWTNGLAEPLTKYNVTQSEAGSMAMVEYFVEQTDGTRPG